MDYAVHEILRVRIVEWVAVPFSRGSSQPRDRTQGSNPGLPHCRQILYQLSHRGRTVVHIFTVKHVVISSVHFFKRENQVSLVLKENQAYQGYQEQR